MDPSIFGTLLESALSPHERHRLGAHYTPRAFIERLLKPALDEPLRADWELAQAEALLVLGEYPNEADKAKARAVLHDFQSKLAAVQVLDPACGSGNFLYVAYDLVKRIEREVLQRLTDLGETRRGLQLDTFTVTPAQFLGLEVKEWAAAIAELVLWIGHLQWFHREHPGTMPPEPVLQRYENIQNRDAVLTWKRTKETDRSRWDGKTFKVHPVTGKNVPDETAQTAILEYVDPKPAVWPEADFIVGNPPFLGNKRMREALGDGYTEALRKAYPDVPDSVDFVLYWWHKAALAVRSGRTRRFGLITTNSLTQAFNRRVIEDHCGAEGPSPSSPSSRLKNKNRMSRDKRDEGDEKQKMKLLWAIPDHPWTDEGAAVRIAMTVGGMEGQAWLGTVTEECRAETPEAEAEAVTVQISAVDAINEDLSSGANVAGLRTLHANLGISSRGVKPVGAGFLIDQERWKAWGYPKICRLFFNGRDLTDQPRGVLAIDTFGLDFPQFQRMYPREFQHIFDHVKPERDNLKDPLARANWWLFERNRPELRIALSGLSRYIATPQVAKHRVFQLLSGELLADDKLIAIALDDAWHLGVLESRVHRLWALANRGNMGVGNDSVYNKTTCFDPFPFPDATEPQKARTRDFAERLDAHRKAAQARGVTITQMYTLREKLKAGEAFTETERGLHEAAQTSILAQLHDELDAAVIEAYGWDSAEEKEIISHGFTRINTEKAVQIRVNPCESVAQKAFPLSDAEILTRLVALNRERGEEEKQGLIRWLRPEYQAPSQAPMPIAASLGLETEAEKADVLLPEATPWPKETREQLAAVRACGPPPTWPSASSRGAATGNPSPPTWTSWPTSASSCASRLPKDRAITGRCHWQWEADFRHSPEILSRRPLGLR